MDRLEKFIIENRSAFEEPGPPERVWHTLRGHLYGSRRVRFHWRQVLARAAVVVLLIGSGVAGGVWWSQHQQKAGIIASVAPEYAGLEQYLQKEVNRRMAQLVQYGHAAEVRHDIDELDRLYSELARELRNTPSGNREQVVRAMIENYQARIEILEQVLQKLEQLQTPDQNQNDDEITI